MGDELKIAQLPDLPSPQSSIPNSCCKLLVTINLMNINVSDPRLSELMPKILREILVQGFSYSSWENMRVNS